MHQVDQRIELIACRSLDTRYMHLAAVKLPVVAIVDGLGT